LAIIAISDVHLGFEDSEKAAFIRFLGSVQSDSSITDFVLLGDIVDMWRRDASGVFLENMDVFEIIRGLQEKMHVHYIAGNHEYHVLKLQGRGYPFQFMKSLTLQQGGTNCRFIHGWEFDELQREHIMESMCHALSDQKGDRDTNIWAALGRDKSDLSRLFSNLRNGAELHRTTELLQLDPKERLKETLKGVEKKARASVQPGEVLIFGHTHRPFLNKTGNLVNTGSWIKTEATHNTFVRLEDGKPRLFVFEGAEIAERADI
jgi:UDP-2,3-diacylglucosamine pyrophosphatase LpxH